MACVIVACTNFQELAISFQTSRLENVIDGQVLVSHTFEHPLAYWSH